MHRKVIALCLTVFLVSIAIAAHAEEESPKREVSEKLIAQIDISSWIRESFKVSPDSKRVVYAAKVGDKQLVVVDGKEGNKYDNIVAIAGGWIGGWISPDSLHYLIIKGSSIYLVEERIR